MKRCWPATVLGVALCLGACSGTGSTSTAGRTTASTASSSTSSSTSSSPSPQPTPSEPDTTTGSAAAVPATDVCAYLTGRLPTLRTIGSAVGVQANLAGNLLTFFEAHGQHPDGQVLEEATSSSCPAVRTEVLRLAGLGSFNEL